MFFNQPVKITRVGKGSWVNGIWQEGAPSAFVIQTSLQPASRNDMELLPEGRRGRQTFALYCQHGLRMTDDNAGTNADRAEIYGDMYTIQHVENWANGLIPHYKAIATREAEQ